MDINDKLKGSYIYLLFEACKGMAVYAAMRGMQIPISVAQTMATFEAAFQDISDEDPGEITTKKIPDIALLVTAHASLTSLVDPAKPQAIFQMDMKNQCGHFSFISPVPLIRHMFIVALVSLITFVLVVLTPFISVEDINIFNSDGLKLFVQLIFLISAAALGASFSALYTANQYIKDMTWDPNLATSYWVQFLLGIISGLLLSVILKNEALSSELLEPNIIRPLLAILGGFSADLLYTFLNRMIDALKSLFQGSSREIINNQSQKITTKAAKDTMKDKIALAAQLTQLQKTIGVNSDPAAVQKQLDEMFQSLFPENVTLESDKPSNKPG